MKKHEFIKQLKKITGPKKVAAIAMAWKRQQIDQRHMILSQYKEEKIGATSQKITRNMMRLSDVLKEIKFSGKNPLIPLKKNWFMRFLDHARDVLYDPNNQLMVDFRVQFQYNLLIARGDIENEY